jgi:hypothetical protein
MRLGNSARRVVALALTFGGCGDDHDAAGSGPGSTSGVSSDDGGDAPSADATGNPPGNGVLCGPDGDACPNPLQ